MLEKETCRRRLRRTRSGRWSSWSSWCSGRTGSSWWWISAAVSSWPPSTCGPDLHSGEGRLPGLTPAPPAGWEVARLSCWTSVVGVMEGCQRKKLREMGWKRLDGEIVCWNIFMACEWKSFPESFSVTPWQTTLPNKLVRLEFVKVPFLVWLCQRTFLMCLWMLSSLPWTCTHPSPLPACLSASACDPSPCPSTAIPHTGESPRPNPAPWNKMTKR